MATVTIPVAVSNLFKLTFVEQTTTTHYVGSLWSDIRESRNGAQYFGQINFSQQWPNPASSCLSAVTQQQLPLRLELVNQWRLQQAVIKCDQFGGIPPSILASIPGAATTTDRGDQVILENTRAAQRSP